MFFITDDMKEILLPVIVVVMYVTNSCFGVF